MKAIVVGRHTDPIPGVKVAAQENLLFSGDFRSVKKQIEAVFDKAFATTGVSAVIFQNIPGMAAAPLYAVLNESHPFLLFGGRVGVIISKMTARPANVPMEVEIGASQIEAIIALIKHTNARAKIETSYDHASPGFVILKVSVDPVPAFEFDRIEWLAE